MVRRRQEKSRVENPVVKKALELLLVPSIPLKLTAGSETGRPDQIFLIPHGKPLFIEFKWGELKPEPKQEYWHKVLRDLGYEVQVHNDVDEALEAIASKVVAAALHAARSQVPAGTRCRDSYARSRAAEDLHYSRSILFLEKAWRRKENARHSAAKGSSSGMAR